MQWEGKYKRWISISNEIEEQNEIENPQRKYERHRCN
jgi:hypothetical protein